MKIRIGFVSNSSSSSFVIIGEKIDYPASTDLLPLIKEGKLYASSWGYCSDGSDFFQFDEKMLKEIEKYGTSSSNLTFYIVYQTICEEGEISKIDLPDKFHIFAIEKDYHSTRNVEDFKERYIDEN